MRSLFIHRNGKGSLFHPFLFRRRQVGWHHTSHHLEGPARDPLLPFYEGKVDYHEKEVIYNKIWGHPKVDINLRLGRLFGLHRWALADELTQLDRLREAVSERQIPLFVLGASPKSFLPTETWLWRWQNQKVAERLSKDQIPYFLLSQLSDETGRSFCKRDEYHWNEQGHSYVAEGLYQLLAPRLLSR
jgi:hypothetical protein